MDMSKRRIGFLSSLHFSETDRLRIEDITKGQSDNAEWYEQRKGCITGSKVNRIVSFVENGRAKARHNCRRSDDV